MQVGVALPLPVDTTYSYLVPDALEDLVHVGSLVLVPVRQRRLNGVVIGFEETNTTTPYKLRQIIDIVESEPVVSEEMLALTRWIAHYYVCGWGEALRATFPSGIEQREISRIYLVNEAVPAWSALPPQLLSYLVEHGGTATPGGLKQAGLRTTSSTLRTAERRGAIKLEKVLKKPKVRTQYARHITITPPFDNVAALKDIKLQLRGAKQKAILDVLMIFLNSGESEPPLQDVLLRANASASSAQTLIRKGILTLTEKEVVRVPSWLKSAPIEPSTPPDYHPAQREALTEIRAALATQSFATFLLYGVTGSGKTEVYLSALSCVLDRGQTGIVLVPEISLTPQTVSRFRARFGDQIAIMHSRMGLSERYDTWRMVRSGRYKVVIGTRSAILAPLDNLG